MPATPPPILLTRPPGSPTQDLAAYKADGGYQALAKALSEMTPEAVLADVEKAHLRGRGGASFPVATKWKLAAATAGDEKHVLANGGEHEPGSNKDKHLVELYPHKVLEGMLLCGYATGATRGWLYLIEDMAGPIAAARAAIAEARSAGILGNSFDIQVHKAPTTYVAGEETAAIEAIEGGPGKPRPKPPYPGQTGIFGQPTTVNNVETLAHVPAIVRNGGGWYRGIGTGDSTGTMLFTLNDQVHNPGVYELPFGSTYRDLIYGCGGGPRSGMSIRAILPALSCPFLDGKHLDASIDHATLKALGTTPGCGGVSFIEAGQDVVARVLEIAEFFKREQCGLCAPCRMQTNQLAGILRGVQEGKGPGYEAQAHKVANFARGKGNCSLIEMAAAPVISALELFADDFAAAAS
ncbi:MAG: NADH-ubiquinone oxidoreductase-F iron-sulfur binding region domain-containing protein [Planctomycetota bacterium]|jgi:NADH:ubiquinone oxidoreductase subunit F (NADH-binding)